MNKQDVQERYQEFWSKVNAEIVSKGVASSLMDICSVWLDRNGNENQVNVEILLEPPMSKKIEVKRLLDKYCDQFGFKMKYVNLSGDLPSSW